MRTSPPDATGAREEHPVEGDEPGISHPRQEPPTYVHGTVREDQ